MAASRVHTRTHARARNKKGAKNSNNNNNNKQQQLNEKRLPPPKRISDAVLSCLLHRNNWATNQQQSMLSPRVHNSVSYGGACVVYAACACVFGGVDFTQPTAPATVGFVLWTLHFLRRTAETLFLFEFGAASVKWDDSVTEFLYYWLFGFFIWWQLSGLTEGAWTTTPVVAVAVGAWTAAEFGNFCCHNSLRNLKKATRSGSPRTFPPAGLAFLFGHVACPHYTFEILSWVFFNLATGFTLSGL